MIPSKHPHLLFAAKTHPGKIRTNNEDRYSVSSYTLEDGTPVTLAIVADGIGGHQAGEVAAQLTVETVRAELNNFTGGDPVPSINAAILEAGRQVLSASKDSPGQQGMGSTVVLVFIIDDKLYTASVGDSRIYLLYQGRLRQVTIDHTWVQEAMEYGILSPDEVKDHPQAHVLRRHVGGKELPEPDLRLVLHDGENDQDARANQGTIVNPDDQILLCTDGLTDLVTDMEIYQTLNTSHPADAVQSLINLALSRGGDDNITLVILCHPSEQGTIARRSPIRWWLRIAVGVAVIIVAALIGYLLSTLLPFA